MYMYMCVCQGVESVGLLTPPLLFILDRIQIPRKLRYSFSL